MSYTKSDNARNDALDGMTRGVGPGSTLTVYTGPRPLSPSLPASGDVIAVFPFPGFALTKDGMATFAASPIEARSLGIGVMGWFRIARPDGAGHLDGEIGPGKEFDPGVVRVSEVGQIIRIDSGSIAMAL